MVYLLILEITLGSYIYLSGFLTCHTAEWGGVACLDMLGHDPSVSEAFQTLWALEGFRPCVPVHVSYIVSPLCKLLIAHNTLVLLLTGMKNVMSIQTPLGGELRGADITLIRRIL